MTNRERLSQWTVGLYYISKHLKCMKIFDQKKFVSQKFTFPIKKHVPVGFVILDDDGVIVYHEKFWFTATSGDQVNLDIGKVKILVGEDHFTVREIFEETIKENWLEDGF